ncbi:MAG: hypothetical protein U1E29_13675 [Coriobacteriia bacterium]|nr:hypothetical protein [Coriobacteriia bacterium]
MRAIRALTATVVLVALLATLLTTGASSYASASSAKYDRVVLLLAPYLSWDDIENDYAPHLRQIAGVGAVGNLNTSSRNRQAVRPNNPVQGALTFSAGSWATADPAASAAYSVTEYVATGEAGDAYTRAMGTGTGSAAIVYLGLPRNQRFNTANATLDVRIGALGQAIIDAGGATAAVGNSDLGHEVRDGWRMRPAALVAMDSAGRVPIGDVSSALLMDDPYAPFGVSTDVAALSEAYREAASALDAHDGPGLLVVDPGDLVRAEYSIPDVAPTVAGTHRAGAVRSFDRVVRSIVDDLPDDAVLIVASPVVSPPASGPAPLAPIVVYSPGDSGLAGTLSSSSTQQPGLVTNMDIAATVTSMLGVPRPVSVLGNPMVATGSRESLDYRVDALRHFNATAVAIEAARVPAINTFIAGAMLVLMLATIVIFRARRWSSTTRMRASYASRLALLAVLSVPAASSLMFVGGLDPDTKNAALAGLVGSAAVLWFLASALTRTRYQRLPLASIAIVTAAVLLIDQWLGGPWSYTGIFSFSPLVAARYYGMGNEGAAILVGAFAVGSALVMDEYPNERFSPALRLWVVPGIGLLAAFTAAAPFWGANVAVALWGAVTVAVGWSLLNKIRFDWRVATAVILVAALMIGAFSLIDLAADDGSQTHLGRAWASAGEGGLSELWLIVARKVSTNLRVLTRTNWSFLLLGVLAFLAFMRWRPQGDFATTLKDNPAFSAAMAACLWGGAAAYVTEDSGIVIPALMMLYVGAGILYLMLLEVADNATPRDGGTA